jgi:sigma-B regulation protein RsbQ
MQRLYVGLILFVVALSPLSAATVDGIPIHYSTHGDGPATLVFVHGWTCDETSWMGQIEPFAERYRVVTLDLPGHGESGSPAADGFSIDLFADAVEAVRAEVGAESIVLIGHSMGAPVIRQYARNYPQHVAGLVPVDGPISGAAFVGPNAQGGPPQLPNFSGAEGLELRETMIRSMFTADTPAAVQEHVLEMMLSAPDETAVGAMGSMANPEVWAEATIPMPVLAVYAGTARLPDAKAVRESVPEYEATQLEGTGHFLMMEKPAEFNALLQGFLNEIGF